MTEDDYEWEVDETLPWASPEIRQVYEAALGRFILEFNHVDNLLTEIIRLVLGRLGRQDLISKCTEREYSLKVVFLELLKSTTEGDGISGIPFEFMKQIGSLRNTLAHGHFDQNPYSGEYDIVSKKVLKDYSADRLNALTAETIKVRDLIRRSEGQYIFADAAER